MANIKSQQFIGISLGILGGLIISIDIPILRLALSDAWFMMGMRGLLLAIVFYLVWLFARGATETPAKPFSNPYWVWVAIIYGLNNIFFMIGAYNTSAANVVFILAFNPMIAAVLSWWLIGERPKLVTWIAIFLTIVGVGIIVREGLSSGTYFGDFFAFACAACLALAITLSRKSGADMSLAPGFGGLVTFAFALPLMIAWSSIPGNWFWVFFNTALLFPAAFFCLALAPKYIPAPQVAMFYLIETVLAPIWVWMIFGDKVEDMTLLGGAIVLAAILGHSLWELKKPKPTKTEIELPA